jgi:hypothetical protein
MSTVARPTPDEHGPRWSVAARAIPATTPRPQLCVLDSRYADLTDPLVARLPDGYRVAIHSRIHTLLAASPPVEPDR